MKKTLLVTLIIGIAFSLNAQPWVKNIPPEKIDQNKVTFFDIQEAFNNYWKSYDVKNGYYTDNSGKKKKAPYWKQFKRWEYFWESRVDKKTGQFPKTSAWYEYQKWQEKNQIADKNANWISMGPSSSAGGYAGVGRINCIAFHPSDNNTYWVGTPGGGLWKTTNDGSSWTVLTDNNAVLGVSDIAIPDDYATSNTIYIATGDKDGGSVWTLGGGQSNDNNSVGVLKSTDGGTTWNATGLSFTASEKKMVSKLVILPSNNNTLFAATSKGIYKTTDAGTTWSIVYNTSNYIIDLEFNPSDENMMYASTSIYGTNYIYRSTDGGNNWSNVLSASLSYRIDLAVAPSNSSYVYAIAANQDGGLSAVYRSTNSGASFSSVYSGSSTSNLLGWYDDESGGSNGQGSYDLAIAVSPTDANTVFVGGVITFKTTNGGTSWTPVNCWTSYYVYNTTGVPTIHADQHMLKFRSDGTLFEVNDGGVYKSTNNGSSWTDKTNGIVNSQMYKLGVATTSSSEVICGLQDNGTKLYSSSTWSDVKGGDGMECLIDYTTTNTQYGTYANGQISRTTNHWSSSTDIEPTSAGDGWWVTPYVIDPVDHNTLYAGYSNIWKTTNQGTSWTEVSSMNTSSKIRTMAIAPSNNNVLYVADPNQIWKTTNGGTSWTDITGTLPVGTNSITYITIKNSDENTLWVTFGGYNNYKIYESTNGGTSWINISGGLPNLPVMCVVENKQASANQLYVGTDVGIYMKNGTDTWVAYNNNLPNVLVTELEIYYDETTPANSRLRAATFGRGLWESTLYEDATASPVANFSASPTTVSPGGSVSFTDLSTGSPTSWSWTFEGGTPTTSTDQNPANIVYSTAGVYDVTLTVTNANGTDTKVMAGYINVTNISTLLDESFESGSATGWTVIDNDADGNAWSVFSETSNPDYDLAYTGDYGVGVLYNSAGNDDWLITPQINLPSGSTITFTFWARSHSASYLEDFEVYLSGTGTNVSDFTNYLASESAIPSTWGQYSYDLSSYAGQSVYLAIKCVSVDEWYLFADDFLVEAAGSGNDVVANFTADQTSGDIPLTINFTDASTGNITSWEWDFGDGYSDNVQNPSHTYNTAGAYTVSLTVSDGTNQEELIIPNYITANEPNTLVAAFSGTPTSGVSPLEVSFTDASSGTITSWAWDFGDGNTNTEQNPVHIYNTEGVYTVSLTISDGTNSDTETLTDYITVSAVSTASLSGLITDAVTGNTIEGALVSIAGITAFSDVNGNYLIENIPLGSLQAAFFATNITGNAPLIVDFYDQSQSAAQTVTASASGYNEYVNSLVIIDSPELVTLDISLSPELVAGQYRFVLNWSATPSDLDSHLKTPEIDGVSYHVYYSNTGSADSPPYATLDHDVTSGYGPETITLYNLFEGTYHYYIHNYSGSPEITTSQAVVQLYDENGLLQTVNIPTEGTGLYWHVCDIDGATGTITILNQITDIAPDKSFEKLAIKPANNNKDQITNWEWNFGDGTTSTIQNPEHTYVSEGVYTVTLTVSDGITTNVETKTDYITVFEQYGNLQGKVSDALTGDPIEGAVVSVADLSATSDANGNYMIYNVPAGILRAHFNAYPNYGHIGNDIYFYDQSTDGVQTVNANAEGYNSYTNEAVNIPGGEDVTLDISLSPTLSNGQLRFVLNWGSLPNDLDSHLKTPAFDGTSYHVYYSDPGYINEPPYATLDHDETNGYGPETITLYQLTEGTYSYYIYNYSGNPGIVSSEAVVQVYDSTGLIQTINVPISGEGLYWNVCTINGANGDINIINQIQDTEPGGSTKMVAKIKSLDKNVISWLWDFGDGNTSTDQNPVHSYDNAGLYTITLTVSNGEFDATEIKNDYVNIYPVYVENQESNSFVKIYPNPGDGNFFLDFNNVSEQIKIEIFDLSGRRLYQKEFIRSGTYTEAIDLTSYNEGIYLIQITGQSNVKTEKIIVK